jgi:hypothetical protein
METQTGGEIEIGIGMVNAVDAPEEGEAVRAPVLRKADKIENQEAE